MTISSSNVAQGSVSVDSEGTATKSGRAGAYYDALIAQESLPSTTPPSTIENPTTYTARVTASIVALKQALARQATALAEGELLGTSAQLQTSGITLTQALVYEPPLNSCTIYRLTICGYRSGGTQYYMTEYAVTTRRAAGVPSVTYTALHGDVTRTDANTTDAIDIDGNNLRIRVANTVGQTWDWEVALTPVHQLIGS